MLSDNRSPKLNKPLASPQAEGWACGAHTAPAPAWDWSPTRRCPGATLTPALPDCGV